MALVGTGSLSSGMKLTMYFQHVPRLRMSGALPLLSRVRSWLERGQFYMYKLITRTDSLRRWSINSSPCLEPGGSLQCSQETLSGTCRATVEYGVLPYARLYDPF
jgi:hypothetical protein